MLERFALLQRHPGRVVLAMTGVLVLLMAGHRLLQPAPLVLERVAFAPPLPSMLPDAYPVDRHERPQGFRPDGLMLMPRTHWAAREALFQRLPNGLKDEPALNVWRGAWRAPGLYQDATQTDLGQCEGRCLPLALTVPGAGEDVAVTTRDCLTQDQAGQLQNGWEAWPADAGVRVGTIWERAHASFQVVLQSPGCPVGRWSVQMLHQPFPASMNATDGS